MQRRLHLSLQLLLLYSGFIIYATTIPFAFDTPSEKLSQKFSALCADPLQLHTPRGFSTTDIVSNLLLFMPFGFLLVLASAESRIFTKRKTALGLTLAASLMLSLIVEFMQFFAEQRVASLLDCLTNTVGAGSGAVLAWNYSKPWHEQVQRSWQLRLAQHPQLKRFGVYTFLLLLTQLPLWEITLDIATLKRNFKAMEWTLPTSTAACGDLLADAVLFAGFTWLWLATQRHARRTSVRMRAFMLTAGVAIGIACAQLFLVAHTLKLRNVLAGFVGGGYGVAWHAFVYKRTRRQRRSAREALQQNATQALALTHLVIYIFLLELQPFQFNFTAAHWHAKLAQFHWLPFIEYFQSTNAHAFMDFCSGVLHYTLLAALIAANFRARSRASTRLAVFALALGLSVLLEILRTGLPRHVPGVTDTVNALLGASLGVWYARKQAAPRFKIAARRTPPPRRYPATASNYFRPIARKR